MRWWCRHRYNGIVHARSMSWLFMLVFALGQSMVQYVLLSPTIREASKGPCIRNLSTGYFCNIRVLITEHWYWPWARRSSPIPSIGHNYTPMFSKNVDHLDFINIFDLRWNSLHCSAPVNWNILTYMKTNAVHKALVFRRTDGCVPQGPCNSILARDD